MKAEKARATEAAVVPVGNGGLVVPDAPGVDKIRDLLFGNQMQDYDRRFGNLEERCSEQRALVESKRPVALYERNTFSFGKPFRLWNSREVDDVERMRPRSNDLASLAGLFLEGRPERFVALDERITGIARAEFWNHFFAQRAASDTLTVLVARKKASGSGELIVSIVTKSGSHNPVCGLDGKRVYLAGLRSPLLAVADTATHKVVQQVGPFSAPVRPFTVNADQTRSRFSSLK